MESARPACWRVRAGRLRQRWGQRFVEGSVGRGNGRGREAGRGDGLRGEDLRSALGRVWTGSRRLRRSGLLRSLPPGAVLRRRGAQSVRNDPVHSSDLRLVAGGVRYAVRRVRHGPRMWRLPGEPGLRDRGPRGQQVLGAHVYPRDLRGFRCGVRKADGWMRWDHRLRRVLSRAELWQRDALPLRGGHVHPDDVCRTVGVSTDPRRVRRDPRLHRSGAGRMDGVDLQDGMRHVRKWYQGVHAHLHQPCALLRRRRLRR